MFFYRRFIADYYFVIFLKYGQIRENNVKTIDFSQNSFFVS